MEAAIANSETLASALAVRIRTYKKEHPSLSGAQMARRFGMPASSLNRIENEEVRVPTIDQVLKILRGTGATGDILKYLEANYPSIAETYREIYDSKNRELLPQGLEARLNDKDKFLIILLALSGDGTSREEILTEFGRKGLSELEILVNSGLLLEEDGVIKCGDRNFTTSLQTMKRLLFFSVEECFKDDKALENVNYLQYGAVGVKNQDIAKKIRVILSDAQLKIDELLKNPKEWDKINESLMDYLKKENEGREHTLPERL